LAAASKINAETLGVVAKHAAALEQIVDGSEGSGERFEVGFSQRGRSEHSNFGLEYGL
jgi:hypothetical protein